MNMTLKPFKEISEHPNCGTPECCNTCEPVEPVELVVEPVKTFAEKLKDACWKGYTAIGMKNKNGKSVPNCVPVKEELDEANKPPRRTKDFQKGLSLHNKLFAPIQKNKPEEKEKNGKSVTFSTESSAAAQARRDARQDSRGLAPLKHDEPEHDSHEDPDDDKVPHLVSQLHKAVSINKPVKFKNGETHSISAHHAHKFLNKYFSLKPSDKEELQKKAHASHSEFHKAISENYMDDNNAPVEWGTQEATNAFAEMTPGQDSLIKISTPAVSGTQSLQDYKDENEELQQISDEEFAEIENEIEALTWEDIVDDYDEDELEIEEELEEGLTPQGRMKKRFAFMRNKSRRNLARGMALRKTSTPDRLKRRSIGAARRIVYKRFLRGRDKSSMSAAEKTRIEAQVKRLAPSVARIAVRLAPKMRQIERTRLKNRNSKKRK